MSLGESIKLRRQILKITLRGLAEQIGVSHTTVDKYEKNKLVPDSQSLIKLSKALQIPIASLLRPESQQVQLNHMAFRSKKMLKRDEKQINAETKEWLERYLQIENLTGSARVFEMPEGFPRTISSFEEAEEAARDLRTAWDLGTDPIENLTYLLEDKGIKIGIISGITKFDALFTEYAGHRVMVVKENIPRARQRFSLAHELGHCLLDVEGELNEEKAMHRFAGAFLVPQEKVFFELGETRHKFSIKELLIFKQKYGLSMGAWLYRAMDLGVITPEKYLGIRKIFMANHWNREEPGDDTAKGERPALMESMVLKAHAEGIISTSKAAELLNQSISTFCSIDGESDIECSAILCT
ncbi:helix-turn-helix domain-containing protein [Methanoregula sp.]|uniref:helix-turn-helix domain-containing protein n=1 Tax=Methanoregula sp. TaxID=2052170 RepID=UPI00356A3719